MAAVNGDGDSLTVGDFALSATENLDGGGSSVMVVQGQRVNRPSGPAGERPVANALLVRVDSTYCPEVQASLREAERPE